MINESDISEPFVEQRVTLDGEIFWIASVKHTQNMYEIELRSLES